MIESQYTRAIHKLVKPMGVYAWKIADRFTNGVPDAYYSGAKGDIWVEYKFLKELPKRNFTPKLSELQKQWLNNRYEEGRNVAVIVGTPKGGFILVNKAWNTKVSANDPVFSKTDVAKWIKEQVA